MPVKASYLAIAGAGAILLWSGLKGKSWTDVLRQVIAGKSPATAKTTAQISPLSTVASGSTGTGGIVPSGSGGSAPANSTLTNMLNDIAQQKGWSAQQVQCWRGVISLESTSSMSTNPTSGAFGWAQALGHGTGGSAGCGRNEYGGYGLSDAQAQRANCGSGPEQLLWMANYMESTYGGPCQALAFHQNHNYY